MCKIRTLPKASLKIKALMLGSLVAEKFMNFWEDLLQGDSGED